MRRRSLLRVLAACPAWSLSGGTEPELRVAVNRTTIESAPLLVHEIRGVRIVPVASGRVASAQLVNGVVDAATGSGTQALLNSVTQPDLRIVLTLSECRYRVVARRSAGIREVTDLRGKRIGVTRNTSGEYFLTEMLRTAMLRESDVNLVPLESAAMPAALARQELDAIAIWEPHAQNAADLLGAGALALEDPSVYRERFNLNTTLRVLDDPPKRRALVRLVRETMRVSAQIRNSPGEFVPKLAKAIATPEPTIAKVWERFRFPAELDERQLRSVLISVESWAAAISRRPPRREAALAGIIDRGVLAEAGS
jgi:sulfonate transport system substrate-binding protein